VTQRLSWVAIAQAGNLQVGRYHTPFESSLSELGVSMRLPPPVFEATPAGKMLGLLQILSEHGLRPTERTTNAKSAEGLLGNLRWTDRSLSGQRRINTRRLVGAMRILAWIEPTASLPEPPTKHWHDRAPLRSQTDEQSLDLDGQARATERSQAPRGLRQRLRRRRTVLAANRVRSRLRRIAADDVRTAPTLCSPQTRWLIV
jgi:hypothetical protein